MRKREDNVTLPPMETVGGVLGALFGGLGTVGELFFFSFLEK